MLKRFEVLERVVCLFNHMVAVQTTLEMLLNFEGNLKEKSNYFLSFTLLRVSLHFY